MATGKRTKLAALIVGSGLFLVGCSSVLPSQRLSIAPTAGQTAAQMQTAAIECDAVAVTAGDRESVAANWAWGGYIGAKLANNKNERKELAVYRACMQTRGYTTSAAD